MDTEMDTEKSYNRQVQSHDGDAAWLAQLDKDSMQKQEAWRQRIALKLGRAPMRTAPAHPSRGVPDFWRAYTLPEPSRRAVFTGNFVAAGGIVVELPTMQTAATYICQIATERHVQALVLQNQTTLAKLALAERLPDVQVHVWHADIQLDNWLEITSSADMGIVMADAAVAHTGSIVVTSSPDKGRAVSLLPPITIVLIPAQRLYTRMGEVLAGLDETAMPAGIHFISGPSRSADIENDLTIGVHGPGVVHALLIG
jgi:L-lactate dehydrogenase complex protein LldG